MMKTKAPTPKNWPKDLKLTRQRRAIYEVLRDAVRPLSTYEVHAQIEDRENCWISTVYRTLEALEQRGLVQKMSFADAGVTLYELKESRHRHYAICSTCKKLIPLANCPMDFDEVTVEDRGFKVTGHLVEIIGLCAKCQTSHGLGVI